MGQHIFTGSGAPATAPTQVGHHYIDTTNKVSYVAVGTGSAADWESSDAAAAIAAHEAASDPHPVYLTATEGNAAYEPIGAAASAIAAHVAAADPHPTYLTAAEGNAAYDAIGAASAAQAFSIQRLNHTGTQDASTVDGGVFNSVAGFSGAGVLQSIPQWAVNAFGGVNAAPSTDANNDGYKQAHELFVTVDPIANSPTSSVSVLNVSAFLDPSDSGFTYGTGGTAATGVNVNLDFAGSANVGSFVAFQYSGDIGNNTDAITSGGINVLQAYPQIEANVTVNGPMQGFVYQPNWDNSALTGSSHYCTVFADFQSMNAQASGQYTSFNSTPTVFQIKNNSGFAGLNVAPNIDELLGNAGFTGAGVFPNIETVNSGFVQCFGASPNVTLNKGTVVGISTSVDNVTNYAGLQSSVVIQDITYTFVAAGDNDNYTIEYVDDVTAGNEFVSISGTDITVHIESGVSTATQVVAGLALSVSFSAAVNYTITGTASNAQVAASPVNFAGGEAPGSKRAAQFDGDVSIDGALSFSGALSIGALAAFDDYTLVSGTGTPVATHTLITQPNIGASQTVTLADYLGVNTAMILTIGANSSVSTALTGVSALGLPAVVNMGAGSSVDVVAGATFAISLDAAAGGGTIDDVRLCQALGIPNGSTTVTECFGYYFDTPFGAVGTTQYGLYSKPASSIIYSAGSVVVGSGDTPTNASVGVEVTGTAKALLLSRLTSAQEGSLTAVNGMVIYNTDTNKVRAYAGGAWVDLH